MDITLSKVKHTTAQHSTFAFHKLSEALPDGQSDPHVAAISGAVWVLNSSQTHMCSRAQSNRGDKLVAQAQHKHGGMSEIKPRNTADM
jgi:hypothetical protein